LPVRNERAGAGQRPILGARAKSLAAQVPQWRQATWQQPWKLAWIEE